MMPDIPRIETERLILRGPREEDMDAVAAFATSEERTRYIGGPTDRFGAWQSLLAMMGHLGAPVRRQERWSPTCSHQQQHQQTLSRTTSE